MTGDLAFEVEGRLFIHFGVDDHFLKLGTFIQTAESARNIIAALDAAFFQGTLKYELIVLPPDDGSFLTKLAVWVSGGTAGVFAFLNTDVGASYVQGLTGKAPVEWAQELGQVHRTSIEGAYEVIAHREDDSREPVTEPTSKRTYPQSESEQAECRSSAKIIVAMTRGVLEKETDELTKIGMDVGDAFNALEARAAFYGACLENPEVKRIGFTTDDDFPIPRGSFVERAQKPARKEEEEPPQWSVSVENIYVTSPNWDEDDQRTRQWKGKDQVRRDCYFVIEDAEFWYLVKKKSLHVDVLDNLRVQWAYQVSEGRPKNRRVLRVLEFNGEKLAEPLSSDAIQAILGTYSSANPAHSGPSLFDYGAS